MLLLTVFISKTVNSQTPICGFDSYLEYAFDSLDLHELFESNEEYLSQIIENGAQALNSGTVYSIPVVYHVMHLGDSIGQGSNVSDSLILESLSQLNSGFDSVNIQFCLAKRDPDNNPSNGINRIDASSIPSYVQNGIIQRSFNEITVKELSIWDVERYFNIWFVHEIKSDPAFKILGFSTFPGLGLDPVRDGVVLLDEVVGSSFPNTLTHEAGHYLNLFHTFKWDCIGSSLVCDNPSNWDCPLNIDCSRDGDKCCDTRPHSRIINISAGCDESLLDSCDNSSSYIFDVSENYMNYTGATCRDHFTNDQIKRMRCAFQEFRSGLMDDLVCQEACGSFEVNFELSSTNLVPNTNINFTNLTNEDSIQYTW